MPGKSCLDALEHLKDELAGAGTGGVEHQAGPREVYMSADGGSLLIVTGSGDYPGLMLVEIMCDREDEPPIAVISLPGVLHIFRVLGPDKLQVFVEALLHEVPGRGGSVLATDKGMPRILVKTGDYKSKDSSEGVLDIAVLRAGMALAIAGWIGHLYEALRDGRPAPSIGDSIASLLGSARG